MKKLHRIIITGGYGFIGSHFIKYLIKKNKYEIFNLDCLTYAADNRRLSGIENRPEYHFFKCDIRDENLLNNLIKDIEPEAIFNFAAETHVDNSIIKPHDFITTNILGTYNILESIKTTKIKLIHISTDEIYGDRKIKSPYFVEESNFSPSSPYSASKASQEMLINAYIRTYRINAMILRPCNNYGEFQHSEKFIPTCIICALNKKPIPIYGDGKNMREWIFVEDTARAIYIASKNFRTGMILNIGSGEIISNLSLSRLIIKITGQSESLIKFVKDRPGHDIAYGMDSTKIRRLGFTPSTNIKEGLRKTIEWYKKNLEFIK